MKPERNDRLKLKNDANILNYIELEDWQLKVDCHIKMEEDYNELKAHDSK